MHIHLNQFLPYMSIITLYHESIITLPSWNCLYAFWQDEYQIIMMMSSYSHCFYEFHIASFLILLFELILSKKLIHDATTMGMMLNTTEWFLLSTFPVYHSPSFPNFSSWFIWLLVLQGEKKLKSMKKA